MSETTIETTTEAGELLSESAALEEVRRLSTGALPPDWEAGAQPVNHDGKLRYQVITREYRGGKRSGSWGEWQVVSREEARRRWPSPAPAPAPAEAPLTLEALAERVDRLEAALRRSGSLPPLERIF